MTVGGVRAERANVVNDRRRVIARQMLYGLS